MHKHQKACKAGGHSSSIGFGGGGGRSLPPEVQAAAEAKQKEFEEMLAKEGNADGNSGGGKRLIKSERGHNRSAHSHLVGASSRLHKLDEASTATKHVKVSLKFSKAMMRERLARKWTQKQLAQQINEKPQVVHQYESGQAIPNATITQKLNKALGGTLPAARDVRIHRVKTPGG